MIKKTAIDITSEQEKISILVEIEKISDDFSHPDGFQVDIYGKSHTLNFYVNIVNLFKPDEKKSVDELVSTVVPGTLWLITGGPLILIDQGVVVIFPDSYQPIHPYASFCPDLKSTVGDSTN